MKYPFTPKNFNYIAISTSRIKWQLLLWSIFGFTLFAGLKSQINFNTPSFLLWLAIFILFSAIEALVVTTFIFFFQNLPSLNEHNPYWYRFYQVIEWCETFLFTILLPLPMILFIYTFYHLHGH